MKIHRKALLATAALAGLGAAAPASATLTLFQNFVGNYGLSTDGGGSVQGDYTVNAFVPVGGTVIAAYLYQANYDFGGPAGVNPITLNGNAITFGPSIPNDTACCGIASARADVTSLMAGLINGGPGGTYNFTIGEGATGGGDFGTDGTALVVVYELASIGTTTVALLDGFASAAGDTATINFADPLDPTAADFEAEMRLGIGFSCCGQQSTVTVNGTVITNSAGNFDDGENSNGALITVGGNDDPFSALLPGYEDDHERYNLADYIDVGDTSIEINTANASLDDNIFFAGFVVTGEGTVVTPVVPEPASWAMMIGGFGLVGGAMRRSRTKLALA